MKKSTVEAENTKKFTIEGEAHELKLNWESMKQLNKMYGDGQFQLIGSALTGDLETYSRIIYAGLIHTNKDYTVYQVEDAINEAFESGKITLSELYDTIYTVLLDNPFYKATVDKMIGKSSEVKEALEMVRGR